MNRLERAAVRSLTNSDIADYLQRIKKAFGYLDVAYEQQITPEDYQNLTDLEEKTEILIDWFNYLNEADLEEFKKFLDEPLIGELDYLVGRLDGVDGYRVIKCDNIMQEQKLDEFLNELF